MAHRLLSLAAISGALALLSASPAHADDSYDRAAAALAAGDPRAARVELLNAIKADPDDGRAHLLQARVYLELGDGVAAEAEIRRARESGIAEADTHHLLAQALLLQNKPQDAIQEAERASPAFAPEAHRANGRALAILGKPSEAAAMFAKAASIKPDDAALWADIGRLRLAQSDLQGARLAGARAVALAPKDVDGLVLQGDLARAEAAPAKALTWYNKALASDPQNLTAMVGKAGALSDAGRMRDMLALTREILRRDPKNGMAFQLQARLAAAAGNYPIARSLMHRAGDAIDADPAAQLLAGIIEFRTGNDEQAIEYLSRLVAARPSAVKARRFLAAAQWRAGSADAAAATIRPLVDGPDADRFVLTLMAKAAERSGNMSAANAYRLRAAQPNPHRLAQDVVQGDKAAEAGRWAEVARRYESLRRQTGGSDAAVLNNLAWAYAELGQIDRALPLAEKAHTLAPANAGILDSYGWLLHRSGKDRAKGVALMRAAAAKAPGNATMRWHLAQAHAADGDAADARREAQAALAIASFDRRKEAQALLARL